MNLIPVQSLQREEQLNFLERKLILLKAQIAVRTRQVREQAQASEQIRIFEHQSLDPAQQARAVRKRQNQPSARIQTTQQQLE